MLYRAWELIAHREWGNLLPEHRGQYKPWMPHCGQKTKANKPTLASIFSLARETPLIPTTLHFALLILPKMSSILGGRSSGKKRDSRSQSRIILVHLRPLKAWSYNDVDLIENEDWKRRLYENVDVVNITKGATLEMEDQGTMHARQ